MFLSKRGKLCDTNAQTPMINPNVNPEIIHEVLIARRELDGALRNFNYADTPELVDIFIHQMALATTKYNYAIKLAKGSVATESVDSVESAG
ncbi:MAG: hypothetical protein LBM38_02560 [Clostridiales bacterium]|jgi:hypothetical protein|nr:hypothetical protein [Clostridiales bacterium]